MMKNSVTAYGTVSKVFHWLLFVMIIGAITGGMIESGMADDDPQKAEMVMMHKAFGFTILSLVLLRLFWRLVNPVPGPAEGVSARQHRLAQVVHWALYALMLAQPLSGLLMSQAAGYPVEWFGVFTVPTLVAESEGLAGAMHEVHEVVWALLTLLVLGHIGAALHHHFVAKDAVLVRMWRG